MKQNKGGIDPGLRLTFLPANDLEKQPFSKCSLQRKEFLLNGVFFRLIPTSHVFSNFLLFSGNECHDRPLQAGLSLRLVHPNATQCLTMILDCFEVLRSEDLLINIENNALEH